MFQFEFSGKHRQKKVKSNFKSSYLKEDIDYILFTHWQEHCVECSAPHCFKTCSLYSKRSDTMCARFVYGIARNHQYSGLLPYGADIFFKRWGKLESNLNYKPVIIDSVLKYNFIDSIITRFVNIFAVIINPLTRIRKINLYIMYNYFRNKLFKLSLKKSNINSWDFDALIIEAINPEKEDYKLNLEIISGTKVIFRTSITFNPGFNKYCLDSKIMNIDLKSIADNMGRISIYPDADKQIRVIFTWLNFVKFKNQISSGNNVKEPAKKAKCVVWDLDNTIWKGVLVEDGENKLKLRDGITDLIKELDNKGVIQTISSKNDHEPAWKMIEKFNLQDYFLYPSINWGPKSENIKNIAKKLNINLDSFVFIDDSAFERNEVKTAIPEIRVYDESITDVLINKPEFDLAVTDESKKRRLMYKQEESRMNIAAGFGDNYYEFLKSCKLITNISKPDSDSQIERSLELIQRTNQLNISGNRYSMEDLINIINSPDKLSFSLTCRDNFGDYGLVGFIIIDYSKDIPCIIDFVLSCRVANKMVEQAVFNWLKSQLLKEGYDSLLLKFVPSSRNHIVFDVLQEIGFKEIENKTDYKYLKLDLSQKIEYCNIVQIRHDN